jgi:hypothetical protein
MKFCLNLYGHIVFQNMMLPAKVTPFDLVYGQEAVLPVEVNLDAYRR